MSNDGKGKDKGQPGTLSFPPIKTQSYTGLVSTLVQQMTGVFLLFLAGRLLLRVAGARLPYLLSLINHYSNKNRNKKKRDKDMIEDVI